MSVFLFPMNERENLQSKAYKIERFQNKNSNNPCSMKKVKTHQKKGLISFACYKMLRYITQKTIKNLDGKPLEKLTAFINPKQLKRSLMGKEAKTHQTKRVNNFACFKIL